MEEKIQRDTQPELITKEGKPSTDVLMARIQAQIDAEKEKVKKSAQENLDIAERAKERHRTGGSN